MTYLFLANGFEELEAITVVDLFRRADIQIKVISLMDEIGIYGSKGIRIEADEFYGFSDFSNAQMVILPGGMPGTTNLCNHYEFNRELKKYYDAGGTIAAICAAPMVLAKAGMLKGKDATIYDGMEEELVDAKYVKEDVVVSDNIITARGPGLAIDFALKLIEILKGKEIAEEVREGLLYSK